MPSETRPTPRTDRPFVGRASELLELGRGLSSARDGRGQLFFLVGEPGIGKTRLADEVTQLARGDGFRVAWGRCWESGGAPAFWPWAQALGAFAREQKRATLEQLLGSNAGDVAQVVPALRELLPDLKERPASGVEQRFQLYAAVHAFLRALATDAPLAIVLDDLHAADVSSLGLLQFVAHELRGTRLLLIGSYRDVEARLSEEVSTLLGQISRDARLLPLARLDRDETSAFVRETGAGAELALPVFEASQGNPLFTDELLRLVRARGGPLRHELPDGVRAVISGRLALLAEAPRAMLSLASVFGAEFECEAVAELARSGSDSIEALLAEAGRAGVVLERERGRWAFCHILYREVLYRGLGSARRAELHQLAADRMRGRSVPKQRLTELAHHCFEAGDAAGAAAAAVGAAEWAFERQAYEDAVALAERAAAQPGAGELDARLRFELALALGRSRIGAGRTAPGIQSCVEAADIARGLGEPLLLARAALGYGLLIVPGVVDPALVALLEEALAGLGAGHDGLRACVMARLAGAMQPSYDVEIPMRLAREAVALARSVDDMRTMATVLYGAGAALAAHANATERVALGVEHERLAAALGDRTQLLRARRRLVFAYLELADLNAADRTIDAYEDLARELGQPHELWPAKVMRATRANMQGRFGEGDALYAEARELGARAGSAEAPVALVMHRLCRLLLQERHAEVVPLLAEMRAVIGTQGPGLFQTTVNEALAYARVGRVVEHTPLLDVMLSLEIPHSENVWIAGFAEYAVLCDDKAYMAKCYDLLLPKASRLFSWGTYGMACEGPIARQLALMAERLGRRAEARTHFENAVRQADSLGLVPSAARTRYEWARLLLESGSAEDVAQARSLLEAARAPAQHLEMPGLLAFIDELSIKLPAAKPSPSPRRASQPVAFECKREGEFWAVRWADLVFRLKDSKGMQTLAALVESPAREFHVLELMNAGAGPRDAGDAGELLDRRAIDAYRRRVEALEDAIEEAESFGDVERAARAREEREQIASEVARAVGLGGRQRRAGSAAERARTAIQRRIKDAIQRIGEHCPELEHHLEASIRTGTFCSYRPFGARARSPG